MNMLTNILSIHTCMFLDIPMSILKDSFIQFGASLLGVAGAIWVYLQGAKDAKEKSDKEQDRIEKDKLRYLYHLMIGSRRFAAKLYKGINECIMKIKVEPSNLMTIRIPHFTDVTRFVTKINQEEHFHAYRNQKLGAESITAIFNAIDFFEIFRSHISTTLSEVGQVNFDKRQEFGLSLEKCRDLLVTYTEEMRNNGSSGKAMYSNFELFLEEYGKIDRDKPLTEIRRLFLLPLNFLIFQYQKTENSEIYNSLLHETGRADSILTNLENFNLAFINRLEIELKDLVKAHSDLTKNMESIENYIKKINT